MKITLRLFRTVTVPTEHLKGSVGLGLDEPNDQVDQKIREAFGPYLAPGFKIFWSPDNASRKTVVGMEVMAFNLGEPEVVQAGLVTCDPIEPKVIDRVDGALQSELRRFGVYATQFEDHQWRAWYDIKGSYSGNRKSQTQILKEIEDFRAEQDEKITEGDKE